MKKLFYQTLIDIGISNLNSMEIIENIKIARKNGFSFSEIVKFTIKIYSSLSDINIRYYLKLPIP